MLKGKYTVKEQCRLCQNPNLKLILDLGMMPLAGDYLKKEEIGKEKFYPLQLFLCNSCFFVQSGCVVDKDELYKDYRYLSSYALSKHFEEYAEEMKTWLGTNSFIVEIGSNDGVLLKPLSKHFNRVLGVDPAKNIVKIAQKQGMETMVDYFNTKVANKIVRTNGQADAIFANNVFAHIDNLDEVMEGVNILLKENGLLVFEVNYLMDMLDKVQYDIVYHEHHSYHSLTALIPYLRKFNLDVFYIKKIQTHFGSIRVYVKKSGSRKYSISSVLNELLEEEEGSGLKSIEQYQEFEKKVEDKKNNLMKQLNKLKSKGKSIVGYGASGRGNILLNYCGIDSDILDYIVDESPERAGRYTPGTHIPIVYPDKFRKDKVDYALLLAYSYKDAIMEKEKEFISKGGEFILPI